MESQKCFLKRIFLKIYRKLTYKGILNFEGEDPDVDEWMRYIKSIPEPTNDIEMSYAKYLCRMNYFSFFYKFLANTVAFVLLLFSIPLLFRKNKSSNPETVDYLLIQSPTVKYDDILPEDLQKEYGEPYIVKKPIRKNWFLIKDAKVFFKRSMKTYPFQFYFNYIILRELAMHSVLIDNYNSKALVAYVYERNIAGPIITSICEQNNMEFVSFMHGEYLLHLIQGFMKFSKFYVWDNHYSQMFQNDLRCSVGEFVEYKPLKYKVTYKASESIKENNYYLCYYFGAESVTRIKKVAEAFRILKKRGKKCKIRPHPRRSNISVIEEEFKGFEIENPHEISIEDSILSSEYLVALSSTVLSEGYYQGKEIVIDDYSEPDKYENLKKRKYILLNKKHKLFSEIINEESFETV